MKVASAVDEIAAPADRDKALAAAFLRLTGTTQETAARLAGVGARTLARWEACSWWPAICDEARPRYLQALRDGCLASVFKGAAEDPNLALKLLERMDPDFAEKPTRIDVRGIFAVLETLPAAEVARLRALPPDQQRAHLQLLAGAA